MDHTPPRPCCPNCFNTGNTIPVSAGKCLVKKKKEKSMGKGGGEFYQWQVAAIRQDVLLLASVLVVW